MSELKRISDLGTELLRADDEIASVKESLKALEMRRRKIAEVDLPEAMESAGLAEFVLENGRRISLETKTYASISKAHEEEAFTYLRNNGYDDIIKREIRLLFGKGEDSKARTVFDDLVGRSDLADNEIVSKESVHPSTLRAFVRRALEDGVDLPLEAFGVHQIIEAKVGSRSR